MRYFISVIVMMWLIFSPALCISNEKISIYCVRSYEMNHFCGAPQQAGFTEAISKLRELGYVVDVDTFYMNTKTKFTTINQIREIARKVSEKIKEKKPDYIVTFDDTAFKEVFINHLQAKAIFFSGLNCPIPKYLEKYPQLKTNKNIIGVEEHIDLTNFFKFIDQMQFNPNKFYMLMDDTPTAFQIYKNLEEELKKFGVSENRIVRIDVSSIQDLRKAIIGLNGDSSGVICFPIQRIFDDESNTMESKERVLREVVAHNAKHLELAVNILSINEGVALSCSPDFFEMGKLTGEKLIDVIQNKPVDSISRPKNILAMNFKRMVTLGFDKRALIGIRFIDKVQGYK